MIRLEVVGTPASQGPKSAIPGHNGGRPYVIDGSTSAGRQKLKSWREAVSNAVSEYRQTNPGPPLDEPVSVEMHFRFALPKSDQLRNRHSQKPDLDHLIRSTADALVTAGLLRDDALIWEVRSTKLYTRDDSTGATIIVRPDGGAEREAREVLKALRRARR